MNAIFEPHQYPPLRMMTRYMRMRLCSWRLQIRGIGKVAKVMSVKMLHAENRIVSCAIEHQDGSH